MIGTPLLDSVFRASPRRFSLPCTSPFCALGHSVLSVVIGIVVAIVAVVRLNRLSFYKINLLVNCQNITFVLTTGGHNAGILHEPGHTRRSFRMSTHRPTRPTSTLKHGGRRPQRGKGPGGPPGNPDWNGSQTGWSKHQRCVLTVLVSPRCVRFRATMSFRKCEASGLFDLDFQVLCEQ